MHQQKDCLWALLITILVAGWSKSESDPLDQVGLRIFWLRRYAVQRFRHSGLQGLEFKGLQSYKSHKLQPFEAIFYILRRGNLKTVPSSCSDPLGPFFD